MKFKKPEPRSTSSSSGGDLYLTLKDGESINLIPRGEVYEFYSVFGVKGEVDPTTQGARARFKINAIVVENGEMKAKVLEFGKQIYNQLYELSQICEVTETKLRLSRSGSTKDNTEYTLLPVIKEPLSPATLKKLESIQLHILDKDRAQALPPDSDPRDEEGTNWDGL